MHKLPVKQPPTVEVVVASAQTEAHHATAPARTPMAAETAGLLFGLLGVAGFSLTLPATRVAVAYLDPSFIAFGRAVVAALCAACLLAITRQPFPPRRLWLNLLVVGAGVVLGFPLLSSWAVRYVPAAHGGVVVGLLPLATAVVGTLRAGERPSLQFWIASILGSATIVAFAIYQGAGSLHLADAALIGAVVAGAIGYAEGGRLARFIGGWQVICWALVFALPVMVPPTLWLMVHDGVAAPLTGWLAFAYVALISMFLAFFAWYHGLALGGVARVSQVQLLQPFLTLLASALLLHEQVTPVTMLVAVIVVGTVLFGRRALITRR